MRAISTWLLANLTRSLPVLCGASVGKLRPVETCERAEDLIPEGDQLCTIQL
jgi:hypothetical protein